MLSGRIQQCFKRAFCVKYDNLITFIGFHSPFPLIFEIFHGAQYIIFFIADMKLTWSLIILMYSATVSSKSVFVVLLYYVVDSVECLRCVGDHLFYLHLT